MIGAEPGHTCRDLGGTRPDAWHLQFGSNCSYVDYGVGSRTQTSGLANCNRQSDLPLLFGLTAANGVNSRTDCFDWAGWLFFWCSIHLQHRIFPPHCDWTSGVGSISFFLAQQSDEDQIQYLTDSCIAFDTGVGSQEQHFSLARGFNNFGVSSHDISLAPHHHQPHRARPQPYGVDTLPTLGCDEICISDSVISGVGSLFLFLARIFTACGWSGVGSRISISLARGLQYIFRIFWHTFGVSSHDFSLAQQFNQTHPASALTYRVDKPPTTGSDKVGTLDSVTIGIGVGSHFLLLALFALVCDWSGVGPRFFSLAPGFLYNFPSIWVTFGVSSHFDSLAQQLSLLCLGCHRVIGIVDSTLVRLAALSTRDVETPFPHDLTPNQPQTYCAPWKLLHPWVLGLNTTLFLGVGSHICLLALLYCTGRAQCGVGSWSISLALGLQYNFLLQRNNILDTISYLFTTLAKLLLVQRSTLEQDNKRRRTAQTADSHGTDLSVRLGKPRRSHHWRASTLLLNTGRKSGPKSRRLSPVLLIFFLIAGFGNWKFAHMELGRSEGYTPAAGGVEASDQWIDALRHTNDVKLRGTQPQRCYGTQTTLNPAQASTVVKRSLKRAQRRAQTNGMTWYRGKCYTSEDFLQMGLPPIEPSQNSTQTDLVRCHQHHAPRRRMTCMTWNGGGLSSHRLDEIKQWLTIQRIQIAVITETRWSFQSTWTDQA